jgi:hypothetical protein
MPGDGIGHIWSYDRARSLHDMAESRIRNEIEKIIWPFILAYRCRHCGHRSFKFIRERLATLSGRLGADFEEERTPP